MAKRMMRFPNYLIDRFRAWKATRYDADRAWYARLADRGQNPRAMIIACCDSRIDVQALLGAEPGELFMVRNIANLTPPYAPDHMHHGTSAAIEYAVKVLGVAHIVVLGHAQCGGVAAYFDKRAEGKSTALGEGEGDGDGATFVDRWLDILAPAYERVQAMEGDRKTRIEALEKEAVLASISNLESFPFVRDAVESGRLTLHGGWFDITSGMLHVFDEEEGVFSPV